MATNKAFELAIDLNLPVASGTVSGNPVAVGALSGVATYDRDANNNSTVDMIGAYNLSVTAADDNGNVAIAIGDPIYADTATPPALTKKRSGRLFGFALAAVTSGSTATIAVKLAITNPGMADMGIFISTVQTGTGSAQNIAHGLGRVPVKVLVVPVDLTPATVGSYVATEGTHTTTNVVVTVTTSKTFKVLAIG
jgi:predicted RecA/RadA family phage recombinase